MGNGKSMWGERGATYDQGRKTSAKVMVRGYGREERQLWMVAQSSDMRTPSWMLPVSATGKKRWMKWCAMLCWTCAHSDEMEMCVNRANQVNDFTTSHSFSSLRPSWVWCQLRMCLSSTSGLPYLLCKSCCWCTCRELWDVPWIGLPHTSCCWSWWWPFPANNRWLPPSTGSCYPLPNPSWAQGWVWSDKWSSPPSAALPSVPSWALDRLGICGAPAYTVRGLNVVNERLFIQPMLWGNWLYIL